MSRCVKINTVASRFIRPWRLQHGSKPYLWIGEGLGGFTLHSLCFLGQCPSNTSSQVPGTSPVRFTWALWPGGCVLTSDVWSGKEKPWWSFLRGWFSRLGVTEGRQVMIATWMLFSLFTVGRLGCHWECVSVMPQTWRLLSTFNYICLCSLCVCAGVSSDGRMQVWVRG